jgi:type I restriction enzyme M protein
VATKNTRNDGSGTEHRRQEVQQAVKNACDQLNSDGVTPRDYVEQLAWLFFLKAFDESEVRHEQEAAFDDRTYVPRIGGDYRWSVWSQWVNRPDAMLEFVDGKLWHYLQNFGTTKETSQFANDPVAERFRRIFTTVRNHSRRGASFARTVQQVNRLHFSDETDVIVLSEIYEDLLKRVASDSAGYAGEFYTQRHIIRAMVEVVQPKIGDRIYDPCFGTAGFLAEAAEYVRAHSPSLSAKNLDRLNRNTFFGVELKPLTYLLGIMNMLLHRIEGANLEQANTLELHSSNVSEKDRYDVILSNPPYGGKLTRELQTNFTIRSGATEVLFLQHIMGNLKKGGRAAVIVPEGVLFRGGADAKVRQRLMTEFDLHTVLSLPAGCFLPYTAVKTNVLFIERRADGATTKGVWFYDLKNDGFELLSTRKPIAGEQISDFIRKSKKRPESAFSWTRSVREIADADWVLSVRNPSAKADFEHRPPLEIVESIKESEHRIVELLGELEDIVGSDA